jgi:hypothetical protein
MSARAKLDEVAFFLELLQTLEEKGSPLVGTASYEEEASFLFSAVVNALYSAIAILEESGVKVKAFKDKHPDLYGTVKKGGVRAVTVHKQHVPTAFTRTLPPFNEPGFSLSALHECSVQNRNYVVLPRDWLVVHALEFCHYHFHELMGFIQQIEAQQGVPADCPRPAGSAGS